MLGMTLIAIALGGCDGVPPESAFDAVVLTRGQPGDQTNNGAPPAANDPAISPSVPAWAADAIFYQIFPERFRNGDPTNDPTRASLEFPDIMPESWAVTPWTSDWYARAEWERELGDNFYEDGVFHRRYGGDLQGVIDKLDYLEDLGINAIYFNPVFYARSLHKYDGNSFHHVDPYFGPDPAGDFALIATETADPQTWQWTAADKLFLELLPRSPRPRNPHRDRRRVQSHRPRFLRVRRHSPEPAAIALRRLVHRQPFDDPATPQNEFRYKGWWGVDTLPEFANNADGTDLHPGPREYIFAVRSGGWIPTAMAIRSDGIDGWRLDVANEVPAPFWHDWNAYVRELNPEAYTVAEIWDDPQEFLDRGGFSATMNYHGFAFPVKGYLIDGQLKPTDFGRLMDTAEGLPPLDCSTPAESDRFARHGPSGVDDRQCGPAAVSAPGPIRLRHRRAGSPRHVGPIRRAGSRTAEERADPAARRSVADDLRRCTDDLLRHRGRHVGRRRSLRPHADGLGRPGVRARAGPSARPGPNA